MNPMQVFLSHLHSDHITDLAPLFALANSRTSPLEVWGPSGAIPAAGTNATVEGLKAVSFLLVMYQRGLTPFILHAPSKFWIGHDEDIYNKLI